MAEIDDNVLVEVQNEIRDIVNWVAVFKEEYDLPEEVVNKLKERLEAITTKLR